MSMMSSHVGEVLGTIVFAVRELGRSAVNVARDFRRRPILFSTCGVAGLLIGLLLADMASSPEVALEDFFCAVEVVLIIKLRKFTRVELVPSARVMQRRRGLGGTARRAPRGDSAGPDRDGSGPGNFVLSLALSIALALLIAALGSSSCVAGDDFAPPDAPPAVASCGDPPEPKIPTWHSSPSGLEIMMSLDAAGAIHDWYRDSTRWMACARGAK